MDTLETKFQKLGADDAPGQEVRQRTDEIELEGDSIAGEPVDFSHGDVDAFAPAPGVLDVFTEGVHSGGVQAYTEYRGRADIRATTAEKLSRFTGASITGENDLIITPGTQGALFLAMGATVARGDKVAIVEPDYFANRKLVEFFDGEIVPVEMNYLAHDGASGLDLSQLEAAFQAGVRLFIFSNPNNPTGVVYTGDEVREIARLAAQYGSTVIVDELYSRQVFDGRTFTHLCAEDMLAEDNLLTIIGPSKTESLSGYRLGVAFGSPKIIERMEKLQAIVSLRAGGYNQAVLKSWFNEPDGWMEQRILQHQAIRDDLLEILQQSGRFEVRGTEAGSYLFPKITDLDLPINDFVKILRLQAGVTVTPGIEFGPQFDDCIRINFSQDHQKAVEAMKRMIQLVERYAVKV